MGNLMENLEGKIIRNLVENHFEKFSEKTQWKIDKKSSYEFGCKIYWKFREKSL